MNLKDDILIEHFLRNKLSEGEKKQFLKRIEEDKNFKEEFLIEKQLFESLNKEEWSFIENIDTTEIVEYEELFNSEKTTEIKNKIKEASFIYKASRKRKKVITFISSIAAAAILFFILNVLFDGEIDTQKIYAENIELSKLPSFVNRGNVNNEQLVLAETLFKNKEYKKSIVLLDNIVKETKKNSSVYIYKAIAHIELNEYQKAESILNKLIESDLIDAEKGYWYKSLLFLKSDRIKEMKKILSKIVKNSSFKHKEAKKILEEL